MIEYVATLCLMAVASGTIALMLTVSHLTQPLRLKYIDAPYMLGELINCPYCMAFWTGLPFVTAFHFEHLSGVITSYLVVVGLSHVFMGVVQRLFLFRESENEELRQKLREAREAIEDLLERSAAR